MTRRLALHRIAGLSCHPLCGPPPLQANHHMEAAKLLQKLAADSAAQKVHPLRVKKLHVLAALEVDKFKRKALDLAVPGAGDATRATGAAGTMAGAGGAAPTMQANAAQTLAGALDI